MHYELSVFLCRPCYIYIDPFTMNNAEVMSSISLDANEVLVVYSRDRSANKVVRKIVYGPMLYTPSADEWWVWQSVDVAIDFVV